MAMGDAMGGAQPWEVWRTSAKARSQPSVNFGTGRLGCFHARRHAGAVLLPLETITKCGISGNDRVIAASVTEGWPQVQEQ